MFAMSPFAARRSGFVDRALGLIGIRYQRGGDNPDTGFDCSGFVGIVFREGPG